MDDNTQEKEFQSVRSSFLEEEAVQKECCTREKLGYEPVRSINTRATVKEDCVHLQFWGWEIVLLKDGTYFIGDTSGG